VSSQETLSATHIENDHVGLFSAFEERLEIIERDSLNACSAGLLGALDRSRFLRNGGNASIGGRGLARRDQQKARKNHTRSVGFHFILPCVVE
jgi:hypothetical protein